MAFGLFRKRLPEPAAPALQPQAPNDLPGRSRPAPLQNSKIDAVYEPGLVALEINKIEGACHPRRSSGNLKAPGRREARTLRQPDKNSWSDKQGVSGKQVQSQPFVFPQITRFPADQEAGLDLRHHRRCEAECDILLGFVRRKKVRPLRLVEKVDRGDQFIGNQLAIERQSKVRSVFPHMLAGCFIDAVGVWLGVE